MAEKTFYITTPLYYVNDQPHIGHAYATIGADVMARYMRARGRRVFFLTGTDEHGQKVEKASREKGFPSPQALADTMVGRFQEAWRILGIRYDRFFRTTDQDHYRAVAEFWKAVQAGGYIEKRAYRGWYCLHEETFWPESQLVQPGHLCPDCGRPCGETEEENFFFRQTAFVDRMRAHFAEHPDFVEPEARRNEVLGSYLELEGGVQDQSISRSNFKWGIPVPGDPTQVIYVWFDALINYVTAAGYASDPERFAQTWPADVHIIGKDILRFHAVLWPSMLMAAGLQPPKKVFGTGFILHDGKKMSKSLGNVIDPLDWARRFGPEVLRYYLLREVPFGSDGSVSEAGLRARYQNELADDLGNLLSRTLAMWDKFLKGRTPAGHGPAAGEEEDPLVQAGRSLWSGYSKAMDRLAFHEALEVLWAMVRRANAYIEETSPWKLARSREPSDAKALARTIYRLMESLRIVALGLSPFMPNAARGILDQLGLSSDGGFQEPDGSLRGATLDQHMQWNQHSNFEKASKGAALFPKDEAVPAVAL